jgi:hypothetical protein
MAQYITLEEAAERLGLPADEFKRRLKTEWTHVVPMRDGPTLRFRVNQIDELARQLGAASDVSLPLAAMEPAEPGSDDFKVQGPTKPAKSAKPAEEPLVFDASDDDIFSLSADEPKPAGKGSKADPPGTDSDVRLEAPKPPKDPEVVPTEEIALDLGGPGSAVIKGGSSAKLSAPKSSAKLTGPDSGMKLSASDSGKKPDSGKKLSAGDSGKHPVGPGIGDSSEFELSLDADSDDFELQLNTDSSDEVDLGSSPVEEGGNRSGKSGINLRDPGDAGISLEKGKKGDSGQNLPGKKSDSDRKLAAKKPAKSDESDSDVEFELSLDPGPGTSGPKVGGPRSGGKPAPLTSDSDSEFELTLDDSSEGSSLEAAALESADAAKGDIFETDFEIPPMTDESGSEVVAIDSDTDLEDKSDVEIALEEGDVPADDTASQVVLLEDEGEAPARRSSNRSSGDVDLADVELEEEDSSVSAAMRKVKPLDDDEEEEVTTVAGVAAPTPWGPVPALILIPAFILVIFGGLMSFELLHTMMGYQQPRKPAAPLVRGVAKALDMDLKDQ